MNHFRRKKMNNKYCRVPAKFKNGIKIPEAYTKLAQVNDLKKQLIEDFNQGNLPRFNTRVGFLRENQADKPALLAKSLSDIAEKISDNELKLALFEEALELNPDDTVTLTSYGTALANHNQPDKAFEQFETSLALDPDNTVTLNSYGTALANHNQPDKAFEQFETSLALDPDNTVTLTSYGTALGSLTKIIYQGYCVI